MKKTLSLLFFLLSTISCETKDASPTSFVQLGEFQFDVASAYFEEFETTANGFNTEFYLFGLVEDDIKQCLVSSQNCEMNGLFLDLYNNQRIAQDGVYILDVNYDGSNYGKAEIISFQNGTERYSEIISGVVEITGLGTENLSVKVNGRTKSGEAVSAEYSGNFANVRTLIGEESLQNPPNFQFSKSFNTSNGLARVGNAQFELNTALFDDYGLLGSEYNMEYYLIDLPEDELITCLFEDQENCVLQLVFIDLYSNSRFPQNGTFELTEDGNGEESGYGDISYLDNGVSRVESIISGNVELQGFSTGSPTIIITGITESGKNVSIEYTGSISNLDELDSSSSRQGRKLKAASKLKHPRSIDKSKSK